MYEVQTASYSPLLPMPVAKKITITRAAHETRDSAMVNGEGEKEEVRTCLRIDVLRSAISFGVLRALS